MRGNRVNTLTLFRFDPWKKYGLWWVIDDDDAEEHKIGNIRGEQATKNCVSGSLSLPVVLFHVSDGIRPMYRRELR